MNKLDHKRLAEGEHTGHYHMATADDATLYGDDTVMVLDAPNGTKVVHQEHNEVAVPPGRHTRQLVQEFDPFAEEIRNVID